MKVTAGQFIDQLRNRGISCRLRNMRVVFSGEPETASKIRAYMSQHPETERSIADYLEQQSRLTVSDFLTECNNNSISITAVNEALHFEGGDERTRDRLCGILLKDSELKSQLLQTLTGNTADIAEKSSKDTNRIRTLDDKRIATRLDDDDEKGTHKVCTPGGMQDMTVATTDGQSEQSKPEQNQVLTKREGLDEMTTPEADRATRAEGGEGQQRYIRQQGESLKNYLHRTRTDIFLFLREALKPTYLTPAQEMKIVEELREAYQVMWQGQRVPRNGKYLLKSECERVISALDGAITKPKYQTQQKHR